MHDALRSPGQPLPPEARAFFEPRFGHNFSNVRVHSDATAVESARAVNAHAYTVGSSIVLGASALRADALEGQRLLAHELTHVVQQSGSAVSTDSPIELGQPGSSAEQEAEHRANGIGDGAVGRRVPSAAPLVLQRAMVCSKRLDAPVVGWFANHAYIDDTGRNDCLGRGASGNYAIQQLVSGNFLKGCAVKTANSTDPQKYKPNKKPCEPKAGVADVSRCLRDAYNAYSDPSLYKNPAGPNSNTFAATLAKTCCVDGSSSGLGWVPGWNHAPAPPCPSTASSPVYVAGGSSASEDRSGGTQMEG